MEPGEVPGFPGFVPWMSSSRILLGTGAPRPCTLAGSTYEGATFQVARNLLLKTKMYSLTHLQKGNQQTCKMSEILPEQDFHFQILPESA